LKYRHRVLALSCILLTIMMLDRVCISVAGPRMQEALHIGPVGCGWVNGMFALAFALFEIPSGTLGDRIGPRRVLTRMFCGGALLPHSPVPSSVCPFF